MTCKWCGKEQEDNAGAYYHEAACHARDVWLRLDKNTVERIALEAELERARYVGD